MMVGIGRATFPQIAAGRGRTLSAPGILPDLTPPVADKQQRPICQPTGKK